MTGNIKTTDRVPPIDLPLHGAPEWWIHQRRAFHFARDLKAAGIYIGMGGGKSRVVVDLVRDRGDRRILIVCPKNVIGVWPTQFDTYAPDEYRVVAPRKKSWTVAKRADEIAKALDRLTNADGYGGNAKPTVVVVNYDSAWRQPMRKLLLNTVWDRVVLDESHRIKSAGGKASRFGQLLGKRAKRRLILTGTPMPHTPLDVYGQYRFLDPSIFGTNFTLFRARYAIMGGHQIERWNPATRRYEIQGAEIIGWMHEEELAAKTYSIAYRIADEELDAILGLEAPIHEVREAELAPATMRLYRRLYDDFCADVGSGRVVADNALVRLLRLAQVTSGHLPVERQLDRDEGGVIETVKEVEVFDTGKADALEELLTDIPPGEPVVVFARFTHDLDEIERRRPQAGPYPCRAVRPPAGRAHRRGDPRARDGRGRRAGALRWRRRRLQPGTHLRLLLGRFQPRRLRAGTEAHPPPRPDEARGLLPPRRARHGRRAGRTPRCANGATSSSTSWGSRRDDRDAS